MNKKLKHEWANALRSGKYTQGTGRMVHGNQHGKKYCCLGVLRELTGISPTKCEEGTFKLHVLEELGMSGVTQNKLVAMNDGSNGITRRNFKEIADYIEKYV